MKVAITGGNGYLGRGIMRRAHREGWDWQITSISRDESKMIRVNSLYPEVRTVKGDVTDDVDYLARLFYGQDCVIHAAANKLVDVGESTAFEVVKNNVVGSQHVALAAIKAGVKQVIGISSDKAVQPVNTYGMTKAIMERLFQEADRLSDTEFTCARYGNVVGSTISIVLYFEEQLKKLGHIKVTNPEMTRFYMGVDSGIDAIIHTLKHAKRGSVVIPKMQSMSVANVACLVLGLPEGSSLVEQAVQIVGERPGEKLHECLLHEQESTRILGRYDDQSYFELRPPVEQGDCKPFTITSDDPPLGPMPFGTMKYLIADAKSV